MNYNEYHDLTKQGIMSSRQDYSQQFIDMHRMGLAQPGPDFAFGSTLEQLSDEIDSKLKNQREMKTSARKQRILLLL